MVERYEERMMMEMKGEGAGDADRLEEVWWKVVGQVEDQEKEQELKVERQNS